MLPDGLTIPVNYRDLQAFIPKHSVTEMKRSSTLKELPKDAQTNSDPTFFLLVFENGV